jgi:hypothetical protein
VDELRAAAREVPHRADVHGPGGVRVGLARVDVVERRTVEDDVGPVSSNARSSAALSAMSSSACE